MKAIYVSLVILFASVFTSAQATETSVLTGKVYDANGALIVGARVTVVGGGRTYTGLTDAKGTYELQLPFNKYRPASDHKIARYDITVESRGFSRSETKNYRFIRAGKMFLDIALDVAIFSHPIEVPLDEKTRPRGQSGHTKKGSGLPF